MHRRKQQAHNSISHNLLVIPSSSKMIPETLRLQNGFVESRPASKRLLLQDRIRRNKSATFGYKKTRDDRCDVRLGKLSRNASFSLSLPFYFNQSLSFSLSFFFLCFLFSCFLSFSFSVLRCPSPTRHLRSLHQAPISRAYRFACHPVGGRSNQSRSRRTARPFSKFLRRPR